MAEIDVLQTGKMLVSSAVHNRDSKSGKFAYTGLFQSKKRQKRCARQSIFNKNKRQKRSC